MFAIILNPTLTLRLGSLVIYTWGLLVSIGIVAALIVAWLLNKKSAKGRPASGGGKLNFDHILNISLLSIIFGFIGSRLLFIFLEPNLFQNPIEIIRLWDGGLSSYGGFILAIFVSVIYLKKNKLDLFKYADFFVIPVVLAFAIARIGCTLVNDHFGKLTSLPWGITTNQLTRHPISAYESIVLFILFIVLIFWRKNFIKIKGFSTFFSLTWYALFRFIIDNFQDFQGKTFHFYANQIFLLLIFTISLYFVYKKIMWYNRTNKKQ